MKENTKSSILKNIILSIILILLVLKLYDVFTKNSFNDFIKAEGNLGVSKFIRDSQVKYSDGRSYKIESTELNDAMFYKEIKVKPNTPYRLSCMVKTENVVSKEETSGACISIIDTTEQSSVIKGTEDWQEIEIEFNSKNREKIEIGCRLGGTCDCSGIAWFSDFILEEGSTVNSENEEVDSNWHMACFILENINVKLQDETIKIDMELNDIETIEKNIEKFRLTTKTLSNQQMTLDYDIYEIKEELTTITYSQEFGYYVSPADSKKLIEKHLENNNYDYIFVVVKLGDIKANVEIPTYDWIGLGGMDLSGIGYSNIRLPSNENSYIYKYNPLVNTFPEEVFLHEFLHTLERNAKEYGYEIPELHDYAKYGYKVEKLISQKKWYEDYMCCNIWSDEKGTYVGLPAEVYSMKPVSDKNFNFSEEVEYNKEPKNVLEEIKQIISAIKKRTE